MHQQRARRDTGATGTKVGLGGDFSTRESRPQRKARPSFKDRTSLLFRRLSYASCAATCLRQALRFGQQSGRCEEIFPPRIAGCSSRLCLSVSSLPSSLFFVFSHEQLRWLPNAMVPRSLFSLSVGTFFLVLLGMFFWVRGRGPG